MEQIKAAELPIFIDTNTNKLAFLDNLTCTDSSSKFAGQLRGLFFDELDLNEQEHCYDTYRDVGFENDRLLFQKYDFRYDITVIMPGTIGREFKKSSGHYHGFIEGKDYPYPEVYEVQKGHAAFILQKVKNFYKIEEEPLIEDLKIVFVEPGESIIIPPFYGHCSINAGEGPLVFSNIAVVSCPMFYDPIRKKHGLANYLLCSSSTNELVKNNNYHNIPEIKKIRPKDDPILGITFGRSVYKAFIHDPEKFNYLLDPAPYLDKMNEMLD